jgi:hypothetical protein
MDLLGQCSADLLSDDTKALKSVYEGLVTTLESAVAAASLKDAQFFIDNMLLRTLLHEHPLPSLIALRLWVHAFSRGNADYRARAVETVLQMLLELNACRSFAVVPQFSQPLRLLSAFAVIGSKEIKRTVYSRMVSPPDDTVSPGMWRPSPCAVLFFVSVPLPAVLEEPYPVEWFLSNFLALLRQSPPLPAAAQCAQGIVRHTEFHSSGLSKALLDEAAEVSTGMICSGKHLHVPFLAALIEMAASTLPYIKPGRFKPLFGMLARLAQSSPELSYPIGEFCSMCSSLPLGVLPEVSQVFRALLIAVPSGPGLHHTLCCFRKFASTCPDDVSIRESVPQEFYEQFRAFLTDGQPTDVSSPSPASPDPLPAIDRCDQLIADLIECLQSLPHGTRLSEMTRSKVAHLT